MMEYKPGSICSVRGSKDDWVVLGTKHDGHVQKYVVQSRNTGEVRCMFNFEVFEKYTSTYKEINEFFQSVTGIGLDENLDFLDEEIFENEIKNINSALDQVGHLDPSIDRSSSAILEPKLPAVDQPSNKRFKSCSETEILKLRSQNTEKTTDSTTKWAVGLLKAWMSENGFLNQTFETFDPSMLDNVLQQFYSCLQSKKGGNYSKSALIGIRAGINRHLTTPPFSRQVNLMNDREFMASNQVLTGLIKGLKRDGKDISKQKEPVSEEDLKTLYESGLFSLEKPDTLQNKVIYEIIAQFGRRGREGLHTLKKDAFVIKTDVKGRRYLKMAYNEADKTHHGLDSRETAKEPRMYEMGDKFCPLLSYEKYISKLHPNCERLFQRPQRMFKGQDSEIWYENAPLGVNKINSFMARLSEAASLSQRYTNHCIRAFVSTHLKHQGFSNESIMATTGHRNVQSLTSYIKPHDDERHNVSRALAYRSKDPSSNETPSGSVYVVPTSEPQLDHQSGASHCAQSVQVSNSTLSCVSGRESHIFYGAVNAGTINVNFYNSN